MATRKQPKIPQFDSYACEGDTVQWSHEGFGITARIEYDGETRPEHSDCYSKKQIQAWKDDEWFFCGVVLSVELNGVQLSDHAASLWGIDCNFPSRRKNPNTYLSDVCAELQDEAIECARTEVKRILEALPGVSV
jgi:hypothetical protein